MQGWLPTGRHNELRAIPTAVVRWQATGPTVMVYALVPGEQGSWPVAGLKALEPSAEAALGLEVERAAAGGDILRLGAGDALALDRIDAAGKTRSVFQLK